MMNKPVYVQLMDSIKEKINNGEYRVGDRILSERLMASRYGINRLTVRNAIANLIDEGYLIAIQGKGTYVNSVPNAEKSVHFGDSSNVSLSQSLIQSGFRNDRIVLSFRKVIAKNKEVKYFDEQEELYELIRLSKIDDIPYALQICYFPSEIFVAPERFDFGKGSLYDYMESVGHMPKKYISEMTVQELPELYLDVMQQSEGKEVFYYEYQGYESNKQLVEFTRAYYLPEFTSFKYMTKVNDSTK